jgi:hypothetical protein
MQLHLLDRGGGCLLRDIVLVRLGGWCSGLARRLHRRGGFSCCVNSIHHRRSLLGFQLVDAALKLLNALEQYSHLLGLIRRWRVLRARRARCKKQNSENRKCPHHAVLPRTSLKPRTPQRKLQRRQTRTPKRSPAK